MWENDKAEMAAHFRLLTPSQARRVLVLVEVVLGRQTVEYFNRTISAGVQQNLSLECQTNTRIVF